MRNKTLLTCIALTAFLAGSAYGATIYPVLPTDTYLRVDPTSTGYTDPLFINLGLLGLTPGMDISLQTLGDSCFYVGNPCPELAMPLGAIFTDMAAVNSDETLLYRTSSIQNINGDPIGGTNLTYPGGLATDIPWDFAVPTGAPTIVTIPTGATFLAVGVIDSWYDDNSDTDGDLGISIEAAAVPEPGTLMLLVPGLGLLWAIRRRQKKSS